MQFIFIYFFPLSLCLQEAEEEEQKCANELELLEKHKQLLESGVNEGLSEATNELHDLQRQ